VSTNVAQRSDVETTRLADVIHVFVKRQRLADAAKVDCIITSLHVHGSLQLFSASQTAKLLLSVTMMKNVSLQYNVSNGTVDHDVVG